MVESSSIVVQSIQWVVIPSIKRVRVKRVLKAVRTQSEAKAQDEAIVKACTAKFKVDTALQSYHSLFQVFISCQDVLKLSSKLFICVLQSLLGSFNGWQAVHKHGDESCAVCLHPSVWFEFR